MCNAPLPLLCYLGADHLTLCGGGGRWFLKKNSCKRLSEEKNCMQHKCSRKLMGRKGKNNILPTRLLEKKILMTRNHPPLPSRVKWSAPYIDFSLTQQRSFSSDLYRGIAPTIKYFFTFSEILERLKKIQTCIFVSVIKSVVRRRWSGH